MKKLIALVLALSLALVAFAATAETAATLKAGTSPDFPPFESMDDNNNVIGFDADLAAEISKDIGMQIVFEATNFDSIVTGVQTGLYDLGISGMYITEERMANVDFSVPYLKDTQSCIVKVDSGLTDNAALQGKKIGSQAGTTGIDSAEASTDAARSAVPGRINGNTQRIASTSHRCFACHASTGHGHITCHASADTAGHEAGHAGTAEAGKHPAAARSADGGKAGNCASAGQQRHSNLRGGQAAEQIQSSGR